MGLQRHYWLTNTFTSIHEYWKNHSFDCTGLWLTVKRLPFPDVCGQRELWSSNKVGRRVISVLGLLPGKSHGQRSLVGCSLWGCEELDTTERLHFHFSLSCIGEGSGNPLQCSCLENPRDGGAWWAAVHWVAQSRTRLKRLSSSSSRRGQEQQSRRMASGFYYRGIDFEG